MYQYNTRLPLRLWMNWRLWRNLRTFPLVKVPGFATVLPQLQCALVGRFHALYVVRDPRDNVAALVEFLEKTPSSRHFFVNPTWLGVEAKDPISALAWRWRKYLESAQDFYRAKGAISFIQYEIFFANKAQVLGATAAELQVPFDETRVQPRLNDQFNKHWSQRFGSVERRNELNTAQIQTINEICGPLMKDFGYTA
jgi:hypothetical protein